MVVVLAMAPSVAEVVVVMVVVGFWGDGCGDGASHGSPPVYRFAGSADHHHHCTTAPPPCSNSSSNSNCSSSSSSSSNSKCSTPEVVSQCPAL